MLLNDAAVLAKINHGIDLFLIYDWVRCRDVFEDVSHHDAAKILLGVI